MSEIVSFFIHCTKFIRVKYEKRTYKLQAVIHYTLYVIFSNITYPSIYEVNL